MKTHHQINTRHCIPVHGGATVHSGAQNTIDTAGNLSDNEVFSRPEFKVLGVGIAYPQGRQHGCIHVLNPHTHPERLKSAKDGFQSHTGAKTMTTTPASLRTAYALSQAHHALARHVPDMAHGFTIQTGYGQINIPPGPTAKRITALVEKMLRAELADAANATKQGGAA
jgi:hypothetical protein